MVELAVVRRYARALFEAAKAESLVDAVEADFQALHALLEQQTDLVRALRSPTLPAERKKALLSRLLSGRVQPVSLRFLHVAVDRRREDVLLQIAPEFTRLANDYRRLLPVEVRTATPLSLEQEAALVDVLARRSGRTVRLDVTVEPELIGGMIVRMGDTVLDGSLRARLEQVRSRLLAAPLL